jgi:hypothetical protein
MTTVDESRGKVDRVREALRLETPETQTWVEEMSNLEEALNETRLRFLLNLRATSRYDSFEPERDLLRAIRDTILVIIEAKGDPTRDFEPIYRSAELLDALDSHINRSMNLEALKNNLIPSGQEQDNLLSSRNNITITLDKFIESTKRLFDKLRNRDQRD